MSGDREAMRKHGKAAEPMTCRWHTPRCAFSLVIIPALLTGIIPVRSGVAAASSSPSSWSSTPSSPSAAAAVAYGEQYALRNRASSLCNRCVEHLRSASQLVHACMPMDRVRAHGLETGCTRDNFPRVTRP